ncbi:MAG: helix-turn-helix transcriptional regulator [Prolixibacteraceae bacterium]|nr:helix-turn-helix transcriptional regulator [Prolixibacteraceae bacterium]
MNRYSEKIKRLRIEKGIRPADVARSAGIKQSSYASIEKGDTKSISIEVGIGIAKALRVDFNDLFEIEGGHNSNEVANLIKENEELKDQISKLLEEQLKDKKQLIDALKTHNLLERFALGLWGNSEEVEIIKRKAKEIEDSKESYKFQIDSRPFNVNDTESMMKYISEHFVWTPKK